MSLLWVFCLLPFSFLGAAGTTIDIASPMPAPEWATLQRRILADSVPAARAFFAKYYDERGYFRHVVRWRANDGPDDAFENTTGWPELHALGASDEILQLHLRAREGMIRQFTDARTTEVPIGRQGMYYKDFSVQSDWMHHGAPDSLGGRDGRTTLINARDFTVRLAPGAGAKLTLAMKRYANPPDAKFPWDR